jgi:RNA polymerase sigma factor (sigma-70 family)
MDTDIYIKQVFKKYGIYGHDAEDISQDIWVAILKTKSEIKNPKAWVYTVAKRTIGKFYKRKKMAALNYDISEDDDNDDEVDDLLKCLSPVQQMLIKQHVYLDKSYKDISTQLRITEQEIKQEIEIALQIIKEELEK